MSFKTILLFVLLVLPTSTLACTCMYMEANTIENNLKSYEAAVKVWVGNEIKPPGAGMYSSRYFSAFVDASFKGSDDRGKLVIKDRGFCGAGVQKLTSMVMFGIFTEEKVYGYVGRVTVFTPSSCALNRDWSSLTFEEQNALRKYEE